MRTKLWSRVVVSGLPLALGCGGPPVQKDTIEVGAVLPLTGANAIVDLQESLQLAIEEINAAGGVLGSELKLTLRDDHSDKDRAKAAATELADANVPVIFGSWASGVSLEVANVTAQRKVVQLTGSSTSPLLTTFADDGYLFRTIASDTLQGELLAKRAKQKGFDKVAVIHIPGPYGEGLAQSFAQNFTAQGGTVVISKAYVEGQTRYAALIDEVFETGPKAVLLVAYAADGAQIVTDWLDSVHPRDTFWFLTDSLEDEGFVTAVGESRFASMKHEGSGPGKPSTSRYEKFKSAFNARFGRAPGAYTANFYDAAYLAALGLQAAGRAEGAALKEKLPEISAGGEVYGPAEFKSAVEAIAAGADVDFEGASGPVDLDANGDVAGTWDIWDVKDGAIRIVEPSITP